MFRFHEIEMIQEARRNMTGKARVGLAGFR
jgi:hypothetical protein